ncbi:MAG: pyrroline-5-carboxylate reductase [Rhodospirillales bacterium]|jgi:pyrroline-5-carboxylate reductase|nr:pyrroline-5-carboxylate reductase [Rhodospirillales bacterium]
MHHGILLVGCGRMGSALLDGWIGKGFDPKAIVVVEPGRLPDGVCGVADALDIPQTFKPDVVLLAVKPQMMDAVLPPYARFAEHALFLSIAAGRTLASFERILGANAAVVRTMPNTPAAVGRGITVACANRMATALQKARAEELLSAVGEVGWVGDEGLIDAVTAVSGSGPAYVFLLAESLAKAGEKAGLAPELARQLARATVAGSGELLYRSELAASTLRENVTSPGGTTAAALAVLMAESGGLQELVDKAVAAAAKRSRELAS